MENDEGTAAQLFQTSVELLFGSKSAHNAWYMSMHEVSDKHLLNTCDMSCGQTV